MPIWLQSMQSPFDTNRMAYHFVGDGFQSLQPFSRRSSIEEPMNPRPLFAGRPLVAHRPGSSCSISSNSSEITVVPPVHNKNYQESRYKTELCRHWEENGNCPHGLQCLFAHGLTELKPFRGRHKKFKTQMCKAFHTTGFCSFGNRCSYIHEGRDVIPLLVQKYGTEIVRYLPSDNEALLRTVVNNNHMLTTIGSQSSARGQTMARVETTARVHTTTRLQTSEPVVSGQSPPRLSVFSRICNN